MTAIKGTNVIAPIVPFDTNDIFASHLAKYGQGGWRTVEDLNERDGIKELRREDLMVVAVRDDSYLSSTNGRAFYLLDVNHEGSTSSLLIDNNNWIPLELGGGDGWTFPPPPKSIYPGIRGERSFDENFIYICIEDNLWKRVAMDFFEDGFDSTAGSGTNFDLPDGVVPIWCDDEWCYDLVVKDIASTAGTGTNGTVDLLVTFTDDSQILIPLVGGSGTQDGWILPPPLSSASPGKEGERSYDEDFLYICVQDNIWKRINLDLFIFSGGTAGSAGLSLPNGSVPVWNANLNFFGYDILVTDVNITEDNGTNFLNVVFTNEGTNSYIIGGGTSNVENLNDINDVTITSPILGEVLTYDGSNWVNMAGVAGTGGGANFLDDLLDVTISSPTTEQFLRYDGLQWINETVTINNNDYTTAGLASSAWVINNFVDNDTFNSATTGINNALNDLQQQINNNTSGSGATELNDLTDVTITSPADNQFIRYNGSQWINETVIINDYTTAGLVSSDEFNSATTGINNNLNDLDNRVSTLENNQVGDYTTAGLASSAWVINNFIDIDSFTSTTTGININLNDLQNQIDTLVLQDLTDVDDSDKMLNYVLTWAGTAWVAKNVEAISGTNSLLFLNDLVDVTVSSPSDNQFLRYEGGQWINETVTINDYTTAGLASSSWVTNNFVDNDTFNSATTGINNNLNDLQNQIDGINTTSGGAQILDDLTDVTITSPTQGNVLVYNGTQWINNNSISDDNVFTGLATETINSSGVALPLTTLITSTASGSNTLPANSLQVGDTIKIKLRGYLNVNVTGVFGFEVQLGGATLSSATSIVIAHPKTNSLIDLEFEFTVRSTGGAGTIIGQGSVDISLGAGATTHVTAQLIQTGTSVIDTTTSNLLDFLVEWNAGFNGNINITNAIIEK